MLLILLLQLVGRCTTLEQHDRRIWRKFRAFSLQVSEVLGSSLKKKLFNLKKKLHGDNFLQQETNLQPTSVQNAESALQY